VEAIAEGDDRDAAGADAGQLHRGFDRLGAGVGEEGTPWAARQHARQAVMESQARLVVDDVLLAVQQLAGLLADGLDHARMGMSGVGHTDARGVVEIAGAVAGDEPGAFAPVGMDVGEAGPHSGHDRMVGNWRHVRRDLVVHG